MILTLEEYVASTTQLKEARENAIKKRTKQSSKRRNAKNEDCGVGGGSSGESSYSLEGPMCEGTPYC
jgi:hypothetical protein